MCIYIYVASCVGVYPSCSAASLLHCFERMQRAAPFLWGKQNAINGSPYQGKHGVNQNAVWMGYNSDMRETKCHKSSPILSYEIGHACIHGTMLTKWHLLWWLWHLVFNIRLADWQGARPMSSVRRKQLGVTIRPPGKPHIISIYIYMYIYIWLHPNIAQVNITQLPYEFTHSLFNKTPPKIGETWTIPHRSSSEIPSTPGHVGRLRGPRQADQREHRETTSCPGAGCGVRLGPS